MSSQRTLSGLRALTMQQPFVRPPPRPALGHPHPIPPDRPLLLLLLTRQLCLGSQAAAMAHGEGLFSRRGKPAKFKSGKPSTEFKGTTPEGEWVAVHCGNK